MEELAASIEAMWDMTHPVIKPPFQEFGHGRDSSLEIVRQEELRIQDQGQRCHPFEAGDGQADIKGQARHPDEMMR
jgi:hypothetical protein